MSNHGEEAGEYNQQEEDESTEVEMIDTEPGEIATQLTLLLSG